MFERERLVMRAEVDHELLKINDLHEKRCRDYAQMVSDECEEEISKATAGERPAASKRSPCLCTTVNLFVINTSATRKSFLQYSLFVFW